MSVLVYYVSGHGFGHAVRSAEIIRALQRHAPGLAVHLRSTAPGWLFPPLASHESIILDAGVVQPDALRVESLATLTRAAQLARNAQALVAHERAFLRRVDARLVLSDIPPPAFLAARSDGLPSVAVANFSWDWIYRPYVEQYPELAWLLAWLREAYGQADLLLRLPFHGDLSAFRRIEDVPLVSRPPSAPRPSLRRRLGLRDDQRAVLLGFGGLGLEGFDPGPLGLLSRYTFIATEKELAHSSALPANVRLVAVRQENYSDLLAACDAVVSKPGFGMVATCLAERVPLLYTDRGEFPEYPHLVAGIHRLGRGLHIPQPELLAANLGPYLDRLLEIDTPWPPMRTDGAEVIARRVLEIMG